MQQRQLQYGTLPRRSPDNWWAIIWWTLGAVFAWMCVATGAIVLYAHLHIRHDWPALPTWFDYTRVVHQGGAVAVAAVTIFLGYRGKLPGTKPKLLHNPPMQRTGAAGMISAIRRRLGRGSGR